jgi:dynein heavy chain 1
VGEAPFIAEHLHMCANVKWIQVTGTSTLPIELAMARAKAQAKALEHTLAEAQRRMEEELAAMDKEIKIIEAKMGNIAEDLADAKEAMSSISTRHLAELASLRRPPGAVKLCITATCVLLGMGHNLEWKNVKKLIGKGGFVPRCMNFDPYTMTEELVAEMEENFLSHPSFNIETMRKASMPTGIMTLWILSLVKVCVVCRVF